MNKSYPQSIAQAGRLPGLIFTLFIRAPTITAEGQAKKLARDLALLALEEAVRPDHPFTLFNLGMTYLEYEGL